MADGLPTLTARRDTAGVAVEVISFSAGHERALLGPHLHGDLELMFYAEGTGTDGSARPGSTSGPATCSW